MQWMSLSSGFQLLLCLMAFSNRGPMQQASQMHLPGRSGKSSTHDMTSFSAMKSTLLLSLWTHICAIIIFEIIDNMTYTLLIYWVTHWPTTSSQILINHHHTHTQSKAGSAPFSWISNSLQLCQGISQGMLQAEITCWETNPTTPVPLSLKGLTPAQLVSDLENHLEVYWQGEWPFDCSHKAVNESLLEWWERLCDHPHGWVLTVSTMSVQTPLL